MTKQRPRWLNRLLVTLIVLVPIAVFVTLETVVATKRAGSIDDVWFVDTAAGPRIVGRDQITTGTEGNARVRHRLVMVDARTGERIVREKVDRALDLVGVSDAGLWFRPKHGGGDVHLRDAQTLQQLSADASQAPAASPESEGRQPLALADLVEVQGKTYVAQAGKVNDAGLGGTLLTEGLSDPAFVLDSSTQAPIVLNDPPSLLVSHREPDAGGHPSLRLSRVGLDGKTIWKARLERQRLVRFAHVTDGNVVLVTAGAARDFAVSLDLATGATRWVHHF